MPYSYERLYRELTGRSFDNRPVFDPPRLTPLRKPIAESTGGVIARALEARGLPTLSMNVLWEAGQEVKPPRTCFLDFPLGCPAGRPHQTDQQRDILRTALRLAPGFDPQHWEMKSLPFHWSPDGSRAWEQEVDALYRNGGMNVVLQHRLAHQARGESLAGHEREFAVKCNC